MIHSVVHIVDDASWGGVNRLLECLTVNSTNFSHDRHKIMRVERGLAKAPMIEADVIVSHMSICWKNVPFLSSLRSANPETPIVHVEHSYSERYVALKVENRSRFEDLLRLSYALFDKVVAVSEPQAAWLSRRGFIQPEQLFTITSCVSLQSFQEIADTKPSGLLTIGAMGRFHEQKGFDILIEAFVASNRSDLQLLLVGDGPEHSKLSKLAQGRSNIIFQPRTANPSEAMALCDIIAMPSRWEPYGLVALEAAAAKRIVLCAKVDGLKQHIQSGAIAVEENTPLGWKDVFNNLKSRDTIAQLYKNNATEDAEKNFILAWRNLTQIAIDESKNAQMAA